MHRYVIVMSNCQTGGLDAALAAMCPGDTTIPIAWLDGEPEYLRTHLQGAQIWVSSLPRAESEALVAEVGGTATVVPVPLLWFPGFHPDLVHVPVSGGGELESAVGPYSSAIVVWSWLQGLDADATLARFDPSTCEALGYTTAWDGAVAGCRRLLEEAEVDFDTWYAEVSSRGAFMHTDNHPRIDAVIALARSVARRIGVPPDVVDQAWESVIADELMVSSAVWPVYPPVAAAIGDQRPTGSFGSAVPGSWLWRTPSGRALDLEAFVRRTMDGLASVDPASVRFPMARAERCSSVLGPVSVGSTR